MRIGIDCRLWNESGIGRYIRNIVYNLVEMDSKNEYVLFILDKDRQSINLPHQVTLISANYRWYTFKEQFFFPFLLYKQKLDVFFVPNINFPLFYFKKTIATIHDLTVLKIKTGRVSTHPYIFYYLKRLAAIFILYNIVFRAKKIFTVSEFVKKDITKTLKVSPSKIYITYCAVDEKFKPTSQQAISNVLDKYNIKKPYILYIGNAHPHKNLERLIQAFEHVLTDFPKLTLVLGGRYDYFYQRLKNEFAGYPGISRIVFAGFIDDVDLPALYCGAELLVNPSMLEGFGIQLLEAFACGTKVVVSNTTALPEIGGNIAYYFNPYDIKSISKSIKICLKDTSTIRIQEGLKRVSKYSWKSSAMVILRTINSI